MIYNVSTLSNYSELETSYIVNIRYILQGLLQYEGLLDYLVHSDHGDFLVNLLIQKLLNYLFTRLPNSEPLDLFFIILYTGILGEKGQKGEPGNTVTGPGELHFKSLLCALEVSTVFDRSSSPWEQIRGFYVCNHFNKLCTIWKSIQVYEDSAVADPGFPRGDSTCYLASKCP